MFREAGQQNLELRRVTQPKSQLDLVQIQIPLKLAITEAPEGIFIMMVGEHRPLYGDHVQWGKVFHC
jgi:hypothetical protein